MRKYDVPLALAASGDTRSIAYARMLFDLLHSSELNEPLQYEGSFNDLKDEPLDKLLELLGVSLDERADHLTNPDQLMNYDVAIALASAGNIEYARKVLQGVDVKKDIESGDFGEINVEILENELDIWKTSDLHNRLDQWLRNNNLPQPEIPYEDKFYVREVAVGWKKRGMAEYHERYLQDIKQSLKFNDKKRRTASIRSGMITVYDLRSHLQKELAAVYGFMAPSSLKFIDYVCIASDEAVWLIEGKRKLDPKSIDQILEYQRLFKEDDPDLTVKVAIVCEETNPRHEQTCQENGIEVFCMR
ncbi:hypothetical protein ES707_08850 [subsurface metagenome]